MKIGARLGRRALVMLVVIVGVLAATVGTAFAHFPVVSGSVVCTNGEHVITWSVWNNSAGTPDVMVLQGVTVTQGATVVGTVVGFGNGTSLPPGIANQISGTTTLAGTMTGTARLTLVGTYPGTTFPGLTRTADVVLPPVCIPTTTTTVATTTTTVATTTTTAATTTTTAATTTTTATTAPTTTAPTAPPTTSATVPQVSSTTVAPPSTVPTVIVPVPGGGGGGNPVPGDSGQIAFTGSDTGPLIALSLLAIAGGMGALTWAGRRRARLDG